MKLLTLLLLLLLVQATSAQYKNDNVAFKTVYWEELCRLLKQHPDNLLLDVRSKGEHFDTSSSKNLNIGRLVGAVNIDIREVGNRLVEIAAYKNKPVFVYCSHSQRSRRVSKLLADSGFVNVYNINGGVSNLRMFEWNEPCSLLSANLPYQIVSPIAFAAQKPENFFILDVRSDSAFKSITLTERRNALGKFRTAINIPLAILGQSLAMIPKNRKIMIVDENGSESAMAAEHLHKNGFSNLSILFNGLEAYITELPEKERTGWVNTASYRMVNGKTFNELFNGREVTVIDIRTREEFANTAKESFRNVGHIKNAINTPIAEGDKQFASLPTGKEMPVVVYSFSSTPEVFETAKRLAANGYKEVYVLLGGLFNLRWRAANMKGHATLNNWVVNVPDDNQ